MLKRCGFYVFGVLAAVVFPASSWADGVQAGTIVPISSQSLTVSGTGVSLDEFMNSLTNTNGLLQSFQFKDGAHVSFGKASVQDNEISIPYTYKDGIFHEKEQAGGTLSTATYDSCPSGQQGKELILASASGASAPVSKTVFQVCAQAVPGQEAVQVQIKAQLVAGSAWKIQAPEAAKEIFSGLGADLQTNAASYAIAALPATYPAAGPELAVDSSVAADASTAGTTR